MKVSDARPSLRDARGERFVSLQLFTAAMLAACAPAPPAEVEDGAAVLTDLKWLDPAADRVAFLTEEWPDRLTGMGADGRASFEVELGRIAFRSPGLLGGVAAREGLNCNTCHPAGRRNEGFFLTGLSAEPGTVDTTTSVFSKVLGDEAFNPIRIPSLEGAAGSAPYGHDGREPTLAGFVRMVVVDEFAGEEPSPRVFDAVVAYVSAVETFPDAIRKRPLTLASDVDELARAADVLERLLAEPDGGTAAFVIFAMRHQIGRMHERFVGLAGARLTLESLSVSLREVRDLAESRRCDEAQTRLDAWRDELTAAATRLASQEKASLYDPNRLKTALR